MKQILHSLKTGAIEVAEIPCPQAQSGQLLIRSTRTLISAGTERMLVEFGRAGWIDKARQQPEKTRLVLDKIKTDGLLPTLEAVFNRLDQPLPLGYCNVGVVLEAGAGVAGFAAGDRVVSNGKHAEVVGVPMNICAKVPPGVSDDEAAFAVVGAVGLQGIRLAEPSLGEAVVVTGLGLIGLATVQLLRAQGCRVLGIDLDREKLALARQFGAETVDLSAGEDPIAAGRSFSRGRGVDAVIITASTTSSEPLRQAAQMCRKRGRIVLVGVAGLELSRADFYEKELSFQVSCSYGPGRHDPTYEEKGVDYPVGFVRWTEQRNLEAVLDTMAAGRLDVKPLISHRFALDQAQRAYELVGGSEPSLGILLQYPEAAAAPAEALRRTTVDLRSPARPPRPAAGARKRLAVAFVGAGHYATAALIPAFKEAGALLRTVASRSGVSGVHAGRKYGFERATTDVTGVLADPAIDAVVIATRHDSHARLACQALAAGKHVFVEKPLALTREQLAEVARAYDQRKEGLLLTVGFNRRFAPQVRKMKALLANAPQPKAFVMTVNAGAVPSGHWTLDRDVGGGRVVGEACHHIDLLRFLADSPIAGFQAAGTEDAAHVTLSFADGSLGTVHYLANGHKSFPKERLEVFCGGRILQLDNFRRLSGFGWPAFRTMNLWRQDKGQGECAAAFVRAAESGGAAPIPFEELLEVSRVALEAAEAIR